MTRMAGVHDPERPAKKDHARKLRPVELKAAEIRLQLLQLRNRQAQAEAEARRKEEAAKLRLEMLCRRAFEQERKLAERSQREAARANAALESRKAWIADRVLLIIVRRRSRSCSYLGIRKMEKAVLRGNARLRQRSPQSIKMLGGQSRIQRVINPLVGIFVLWSAVRALGLQVVTQGDAKGTPPSSYELHSPMVVEAAFPIGQPSAWKKIKSLEGFKPGQPLTLTSWPAKLGKEVSLPDWYALGRFACDGVSLREEVTSHGRQWNEPGLRIQELRRVPSGFEVTLEATLYNPKTNLDRLVTLSIDALAEDNTVIATGSRLQKAPANSKSGNNADILFLFSPDDMNRVAKLRLTMSTKGY